MSDSLVTLQELQEITKLNDAALCWLLRENKLPVQLDAERGILIDTSRIDQACLVDALQRKQAELLEASHGLFVEQCGTIIRKELREILDATFANMAQQLGRGRSNQ